MAVIDRLQPSFSSVERRQGIIGSISRLLNAAKQIHYLEESRYREIVVVLVRTTQSSKLNVK